MLFYYSAHAGLALLLFQIDAVTRKTDLCRLQILHKQEFYGSDLTQHTWSTERKSTKIRFLTEGKGSSLIQNRNVTDADLLLTNRLLLTNDSSLRLFLLRSSVSRLGRPEKSCAVTMVMLFSLNGNKWR